MYPRFAIAAKVAILLIAIFALQATFTLIRLNEQPNVPEEITSYDDVLKSYNAEHIPKADQAKETYIQALGKVASPDKVVLIALVDWGFMDMILNFYESSLFPYNIENYLFLASDDRSCVFLNKIGISCHVYVTDESGAKASEYQR